MRLTLVRITRSGSATSGSNTCKHRSFAASSEKGNRNEQASNYWNLCLSQMVSSPSPSFSSPSSSAVTIPVPGKSILKQSAPAQNTLLSRITRFLPNQNQTQPSPDDVQPLKRAHFILPEIAVVYPISSLNPPSTPTLKEEKRSIEDREYERRRRVLRGNSGSGTEGSDDFWSMEKVESFYRECCAGCDEQPDTAISTAFKVRLVLHFRLIR